MFKVLKIYKPIDHEKRKYSWKKTQAILKGKRKLTLKNRKKY